MSTAKELINEIFNDARNDAEIPAEILAKVKALYNTGELNKKKIGEALAGLRGGNNG
jgi:hypothetical protein